MDKGGGLEEHCKPDTPGRADGVVSQGDSRDGGEVDQGEKAGSERERK